MIVLVFVVKSPLVTFFFTLLFSAVIYLSNMNYSLQYSFTNYHTIHHLNLPVLPRTPTVSRFTNCSHVREGAHCFRMYSLQDSICKRLTTGFWLFRLDCFNYTSSLPPVSAKQYLRDKEPCKAVCTEVNITFGD